MTDRQQQADEVWRELRAAILIAEAGGPEWDISYWSRELARLDKENILNGLELIEGQQQAARPTLVAQNPDESRQWLADFVDGRAGTDGGRTANWLQGSFLAMAVVYFAVQVLRGLL